MIDSIFVSSSDHTLAAFPGPGPVAAASQFPPHPLDSAGNPYCLGQRFYGGYLAFVHHGHPDLQCRIFLSSDTN